MAQNQNEGEAKLTQTEGLSFVLIPLNQGLYFKRAIELDITPINTQQSATALSIIPKFLNDGKYYTPSFILEYEKVKNEKTDRQFQNDLEERIKRQEDQSRQIQMPRPYTGRKFCYICKQPYADYLEHTNHKSHLHKLKTNRYRNMIAHMCRDHYPTYYLEKPKRNKHLRNSNRKQGQKVQNEGKQIGQENAVVRQPSNNEIINFIQNEEGYKLFDRQERRHSNLQIFQFSEVDYSDHWR